MSIITPLLETITSLDYGAGGMIVALIAIIVTALTITRNTKDIKTLMFPIAIAYSQTGFAGANFYLTLALGALFVYTTFGTPKIIQSKVIQGLYTKGTSATETVAKTPQQALTQYQKAMKRIAKEDEP